jgi:hypothetical protein
MFDSSGSIFGHCSDIDPEIKAAKFGVLKRPAKGEALRTLFVIGEWLFAI